MRSLIAIFCAGLVFGLGLIVSGMTDPLKVLAFLDLAGAWNPSLMVVMAGAVGVAAFPFAMMRRRHSSFLGESVRLPTSRQIDARLIVGSLMFGAGWGLAGLCPGPALVNVAAGHTDAVIFSIAMLVGMWTHAWWSKRTS